MAYCVKCGAALEAGAKFCPTCGARQDSQAEWQTPAAGSSYSQGPSSYSAQRPTGDPWDLEPKKRKKGGKTALIVIAVVVVLALIGGGALSSLGSKDMTQLVGSLVQGNLDEIYLGRYSDEFMELVGSSQAECEQVYLDGLAQEVDYFLYYWNIESPTEELKSELTELYKEIYSHSRYTVGECSQLDEKTYAVKLDVYPIDIMQQVSDAIDAGGMDWFYEKYADFAPENASQEEYDAWDQDWANGIVDLVRAKLPDIGYTGMESRAIQVVQKEDGHWIMDDGDMSWIDVQMIYYP